MLRTQSFGPGRFADFDLSRVPSPCFVIDEVRLRENLEILRGVSEAADTKVLLALKAFAMWSLAPLISEHLNGTCASGLWEAKLARKHFGGELATYAPAFKASEFDEIAALSDHIVFNSPAQIERYAAQATAAGVDFALRINPEHSEAEIALYDPCASGSRLGYPMSQLETLPDGLSGLHLHNLCEQGLAPLKRTVEAVRPFLEAHKGKFQRLNLGGGHLITRDDYDRAGLIELLREVRADLGVDLYIEPGTAIGFDSAILVGEVLDVTENDGPVGITDISPTCHMPDVIEAPYRPAMLGESGEVSVRLGGASCLSGDVIGRYQFDAMPQAGQRIAFLDQAHYTMVKTTTFNGAHLPALAIWNSETDALRVVKEFNYEDFEGRLS
jgi:carboxynorspermidine decarboxylase